MNGIDELKTAIPIVCCQYCNLERSVAALKTVRALGRGGTPMARALRAVLIAFLCIAPIFPANAARGDFAIPIATRDRIVTCAAANFAAGMTALNKLEQDDRIKRSATFTLVIVEAEDADRKSLQGEMMAQVAPFVEMLRQDRQRAWSIIKDCDAILRVGELYSDLAARGAP